MTCRGGATKTPGRRCRSPSAGQRNLALLKSPLKGSLAGLKDIFHGCGATTGKTAKFYVVLQPGHTIAIGQTSNSFDSKHSIFWSTGANPKSYPTASGSKCVDDPDTHVEHMTNSGSAARKLWFVVNGYSSGAYGSFTLAWTISTAGD